MNRLCLLFLFLVLGLSLSAQEPAGGEALTLTS